MAINSHVQLNQAIMKRFSHKGIDPDSGAYKSKVDMVFYLDIKDMEIKEKKICDLGVEKGYYSENTENELSKIENEFIAILNDIDKKGIRWLHNFEHKIDIIKQFIVLLVSRSKKNLQQVREIALQEDFKKLDYLVNYIFNPDVIIKETLSHKTNLLDNYNITLVFNETETNFVIPRCGIYFFERKNMDIDWILFPIGGNKALLLFNALKKYNFLDPDGKISPLAITKETANFIRSFNLEAYKMEVSVDNDFVIGKNKAELEFLIQDIKNIKRQ